MNPASMRGVGPWAKRTVNFPPQQYPAAPIFKPSVSGDERRDWKKDVIVGVILPGLLRTSMGTKFKMARPARIGLLFSYLAHMFSKGIFKINNTYTKMV